MILVINFNKVDLPDPFTPIRATVSPFLISRLILSSTVLVSAFLWFQNTNLSFNVLGLS